MKKVKVAIFTAYYNRENDVEESITSLLNQSYDDFIVVAIDDGSTDNTLARLNEMKNDKLIIISKKNSGFVDSMKQTIASIDSEFVAIHGSGDISYPDRIKLQVDILEKHPSVGVVGCHYRNTDLARGITHEYVELSGLIEGRKMLTNLRKKNPLTQGEVMMRRSAYDKVGGYNTLFVFSQDYDLWVRLSKIVDFYILPVVLYERYIRLDGVSGNVNTIAVQQYLASVARLNSLSYSVPITVNNLIAKKKDPTLSKRLMRLSIRAIIYEKSYPYSLAKVNVIELGFLGCFINLFLNICRLRVK